MTQIANNFEYRPRGAGQTFDGYGASVEPMSHELVDKLTINRRDKSEENNHWSALRAGDADSFCTNQYDDDRGNDNKHKTGNGNRNYYKHNLHRWHGYNL